MRFQGGEEERMNMDAIQALRQEERITLMLRALYEQYGYRKYRTGKFEEYDLYLENKNFLRSPQIITFHDLDGRVLALKPDVTLSIAKNTHATKASSEKVYYAENVYWLDKQSGGFREVSQLGLESIGDLDGTASCEVLYLAQETLSFIDGRHMMQVSHIGFWVSLLEALGIEEGLQREILACVHGKRLHELKALLAQRCVAPAAAEWLMKAAGLCGEFTQTLGAARRIALCSGMTAALDELERVYALLCRQGQGEKITLDFSLVNDCDYYDGLIFQGFVEGVPRAVLTGGYYGKLLRKFGRNLDAIGFAVYLNELEVLFRGQRHTDVDALILYDEGADAAGLWEAAQEMRKTGLSVRVERQIPEGIRCGRICRYGKDGLRKEAGNDA